MGKLATSNDTLQLALQSLASELEFDDLFGKTGYREGLAKTFLYKFFLELQPSLPGIDSP